MSGIADITPRPSERYWATTVGDELASQIRSRFLEYQRELELRGYYKLWRAIAQTYYGYDPVTNSISSDITPGGEVGEILKVHVNQFESFIARQVALTTGDALAFDVMASNNSPESSAQASLGRALIEHYETRVGAESVAPKRVRQCERMFLFGAGYMTKLWDPLIGPDAGTEDVPMYGPAGEPLMEPQAEMAPPLEGSAEPGAGPQQRVETKVRRGGDIVCAIYGPQDVARDLGARSHSAVRWYVVRERWDKWELAARYPEHRAYILERPAYDRDETARLQHTRSSFELKTDQVHVLRLLHDRCPQIDTGLEALVCGERLLVPALPLAYPRLPLHAMVAHEHLDRALGYPPAQNMLGLQAAHNAAWIAGITRADAGALPKWAISRKSNIEHRKLGSDGMVIEYDVDPQAPNAGLPMLMEVPAITESDLALIDRTEGAMESVSGVNAVVRGKSEGKSGADNALIQAQAVQSQSRFMLAYTQSARSDVMGTIECFQTFAADERELSVIGEDEAPTIEYVSKDKLKAIRSVEVRLGDPVTRTSAGRLTLAREAQERFPREIGFAQFMEVVATGRTEPLYRASQNEVRLIRAENVHLAKGNPPAPGAQPEPMLGPDGMPLIDPATGQPVMGPPHGMVRALICDNHPAHIREHTAELSSPTLRANPHLAKAILEHSQEHEMLWEQLRFRPGLLAATGQPPPPPPPMPGGMPPPEEEAPKEGPSDASGSAGAGPKADQAAVPGANGVANLPRAPKNPATGEPAPLT